MLNESPILSVIVVVHDQYLPYLKTAIRSLKSQTLNDFEVIVVFNGCNAISGDFISVPVPHSTLAKASNIGCTKARGAYLVRIDADDWIDQTLLEEELNYLLENPNTDAVWCDYITAHEVDNGKDWKVYNLNHLPNPVLEHACGVMFRKSCWETIRYDETLKYQESYDFWSRFKQQYSVARLEKPLYVYRRGHESMSTNPERMKIRRQLEAKYGA